MFLGFAALIVDELETCYSNVKITVMNATYLGHLLNCLGSNIIIGKSSITLIGTIVRIIRMQEWSLFRL